MVSCIVFSFIVSLIVDDATVDGSVMSSVLERASVSLTVESVEVSSIFVGDKVSFSDNRGTRMVVTVVSACSEDSVFTKFGIVFPLFDGKGVSSLADDTAVSVAVVVIVFFLLVSLCASVVTLIVDVSIVSSLSNRVVLPAFSL